MQNFSLQHEHSLSEDPLFKNNTEAKKTNKTQMPTDMETTFKVIN